MATAASSSLSRDNRNEKEYGGLSDLKESVFTLQEKDQAHHFIQTLENLSLYADVVYGPELGKAILYGEEPD